MRNIKEILRLKWEANISVRQIAKSFNYSPSTVISIINRAKADGLTWPLPKGMDETELEGKIYQNISLQNSPRPLPDMNYIHRELKRKGVTLQFLWQKYKLLHPDGLMYSQFCERYHRWRGQLDVSMRQVHRAGENVFVDWAGQTMPVVAQKTGEKRDAYLFIAVLGASNYTYVEASLSQDLAHWIAAHCRAFAFFEGVPVIVVPDNPRTGVTRPCYYEPEINPTYQDYKDAVKSTTFPHLTQHK